MDKRQGIYRAAIWATAVICLLGSSSGCTRRFFRKQVDCEVDAVLLEKDQFPAWKIENMHVYPDARARHADPTNPDRPPMPPDDPAARYLGPNPQKPRRQGTARVEGTGYLELLAQYDSQNREQRGMQGQAANVTDVLRTVAHLQKAEANAADLAHASLTHQAPTGEMLPEIKTNPYLLRIDQAMELGLVNSREFQTRREDLYLAALPVTRERFSFGAQFFALEHAVREHTGADVGLGAGDRWQFASTTGFSKLFSTGALLLFGFANQTVVELNNPVNTRLTSTSGVNLDFIQPLLRGGGRAATLEPLTQVERNLLYEIRDYARFRKQYYQYLIGGGDLPGIGSTSAGSLAATHSVPALAVGNPARQQIAPSGSGSLQLGFSGSAPSEGYLPSIFKVAQLQNEIANVDRLNDLVKLFDRYESGGLITPLQVGQARLQVFDSQSRVLARALDVRDSLDNFKLQLGVPVTTPIQLEDDVINPITAQLARYDEVLKDFTGAIDILDKLDAPDKAPKIRGELELLLTKSNLARQTEKFKLDMQQRWQHWDVKSLKDNKALLDQLDKQRDSRKDLKKRRAVLEMEIEKRKADPKTKGQGPSTKELEHLQTLDAEIGTLDIDIAVGELEFSVRQYEKAPWQKLADEGEKAKTHAARWRDVRNTFKRILGEANTERFRIVSGRWQAPPAVVVAGADLVRADVEDAYHIAMQTALDQRLDLMNTRAQVVDAWRQLRVFANNLLGTFTVGYHMDSSTPPDSAKALAFAPSRTRHQLGMSFEAPLVRLTERNAFRASQIAYQRARRNLDQYEDEIVNQVRSEVRQLQVLAQNLLIQQKSLELAYQQVQSSLETFRAPKAPNQGGNPDADAFSLTQQLLQAYRGLPAAQNTLLKTWIDYHIVRQQLFLDLELMPLDARGVWLDEYATQPSGRQRDELERQSADPPVHHIPTRDASRARR